MRRCLRLLKQIPVLPLVQDHLIMADRSVHLSGLPRYKTPEVLLCRCLWQKRIMSSRPQPDESQPLVEGVDYYMDGPYLVFTEACHLKRGYCCQSGCRHCPWRETETFDYER